MTHILSSIRFPKLKLQFEQLPDGFEFFGMHLAFHGILVACALIFGLLMAQWQAKRTKQQPEIYLDFALYAIVCSFIGARVFYVLFQWEEYQENFLQVFNVRDGGLSIYGAIIAALITAAVYCKAKRLSFALLTDTAVIGLLTGQVIGRFGNFFSREAFGCYTDGLFTMQIAQNDAGVDFICTVQNLVSRYDKQEQTFLNILEIRDKAVVLDGIRYIQVHPLFLYEIVWNIILLLFLFLYTNYKKFDGEILLLYLCGYGLGRVWIESLRIESVVLWGINLSVTQIIAAVFVVIPFLFLVLGWKREHEKKK